MKVCACVCVCVCVCVSIVCKYKCMCNECVIGSVVILLQFLFLIVMHYTCRGIFHRVKFHMKFANLLPAKYTTCMVCFFSVIKAATSL